MSQYTREEILKMIEENGGPEGLDLSGADLSGIHLGRGAIADALEEYQRKHRDQTPVWFSEASRGIDLRKAKLIGTNLQEAHLWGANLQEAILEGANLSQAGLGWANLQEASLVEVNLQKALLPGANLQAAKLGHANLHETSLVEANLQEASLWGANAQKASFQGAILQKAGLAGVDLQKANLRGAVLQEAKLWDANLREADLKGAVLQEAGLRYANLQEANLEGARAQEADLTGASLQKASLREANLREASLWRANLQEAVLVDANLQKANLSVANLQKVNLLGANLEKVNLLGAHLERVDMYYVESLAGAYFHGAFLDQTKMKKEQLGRQIGEETDEDYYKAKEAYLLLKNNFNQIGRYDDASWAYVKERQMEKMTHWPLSYAFSCYGESDLPKVYGKWSRRVDVLGFRLRHLRLSVTDWITEWLCLYGESPLRVIAWAAAFAFLIFPLLYALFGGVGTTDGSPVTWSEYLRLSLASFATIELANVQAQGIAAQFLRTFEALTGISLLALLMFTLGNRISRS